MPSDRSLVEHEMERVELRPFTLDGFHHRREQKQRNKRIRAGVVALVVAAVGIGALVRAFPSGTVPADDARSTFVGTWTSTELEFRGSSQTMTIRPAEDGTLDIALHDDSSWLCSDRQTRVDDVDTPSRMTGTGRLEDATTLVVPSPALACVDGREPGVSGLTEEGRTSYTLVLDSATDRLFDSVGVTWHRGATPESEADTTSEGGGKPWSAYPMPGGTFAMLGGELTFHAPEGRPWIDQAEAYIDPRWFFLLGEPEFGLPDGASIDIVANPLPEAFCDEAPPGVLASAAAVIRAIRSNPDLEVTEPVADRVGGIDALRLDVAAVPGASACLDGVPLLSAPGRPWGDIAPGELARLYVLEPPGGYARTLVIVITAPEAAFERVLEAAAPVVESFEFHTG